MAGINNPEKLFNFYGSFKNKADEKNFLNSQRDNYLKRIRIALILTALAYLGGIPNDYMALGDSSDFIIMIVARVITFLSALICIIVSFNKGAGRGRTVQNTVFLYFLMITATECLELVFKPDLGSQQIPFLLFVMTVYYLFFPVNQVYIVTGAVLGTISYSSVLILLIKIPLASVLPVILTFILVNFLIFYIAGSLNKAKRKESYAVKELVDINNQLQKEVQVRMIAEEKLTKLAITDELTKAYNRRHFISIADKELKRSIRTDRPVSLLFMDIDHFKTINDRFGHDAGDSVLKKVSETCALNLREIDIFARFGGEEFAVLLPETALDMGEDAAQRLRKLLSEIRIIIENNIELSITVSIGVSCYDKEYVKTLEEMIKYADQVLYEAKENGRNRIAVYRPETARSLR